MKSVKNLTTTRQITELKTMTHVLYIYQKDPQHIRSIVKPYPVPQKCRSYTSSINVTIT